MHTTRNQSDATTRWRLDPTDSSAEFGVPHFWGLLTVKGRFDRLDGRLEADHDGPQRIELTIEAASVSTRNRQRDRHLRSADFFDVDRHPKVCFRSTAIRTADDGSLRVAGELTAAGTGLRWSSSRPSRRPWTGCRSTSGRRSISASSASPGAHSG